MKKAVRIIFEYDNGVNWVIERENLNCVHWQTLNDALRECKIKEVSRPKTKVANGR